MLTFNHFLYVIAAIFVVYGIYNISRGVSMAMRGVLPIITGAIIISYNLGAFDSVGATARQSTERVSLNEVKTMVNTA